ncbi:MAG: hypothetical protein WAS56_10815 [Saprospiraceae bacterium]
MQKLLKYIPILLILIGLPLFSWYYLNKGTTMRRDAMKSLVIKSKVSNFQILTDDDSTFTNQGLVDKRWFVLWLPQNADRENMLGTCAKIYDLAKDDFQPHFFSIIGFTTGENANSISELFSKKLNRKYWKNAFIEDEHFSKFGREIFGIPESLISKSIVVLIDDKAQVRNYYNIEDPVVFKQLVREYPVFLSLKQ